MLVIPIPYIFSQEGIDNSQSEEIEKQFNKLSSEHKNIVLPMLQEAVKNALMEASPEEQESMIQQMKQNLNATSPEGQEVIIQQMQQMFPPDLLEKLLPSEKK